MTGTSTDGLDAAAMRFAAPEYPASVELVAAVSLPFDRSLRDDLLLLQNPLSLRAWSSSQAGHDLLLHVEQTGLRLSKAYADCVQHLLASKSWPRNAICAVGAHGQTLRHRPELGVTLQLLDPHTLAETTGLSVVSDFRRRDVAAGGQGAPLVPAFHRYWLAARGLHKALVLNIGGFANISVLAAEAVYGTDCGPGNVLMDAWIQQHLQRDYDAGGAWAATGRVSDGLLQIFLQHPFFRRALPGSTGRDDFSLQWLNECLDVQRRAGHRLTPVDVQATLLALTVQGIARAVEHYALMDADLVVCGGGAYNRALLNALQQALPAVRIRTGEEFGLPAQFVEAAAFAWLARQAWLGLPGNLPAVTGAAGWRVLGSITHA
jgi:anhydro-N-acetylmuramic acid kinase